MNIPRFVVLTLATGGFLAMEACNSPTAPKHVPAVTKAIGDACTTADGRSGYTVSLGDKLVCQPYAT